jgi:3'-phosphoadenosine 5'-phosphosulfate sulfotransferase (PAPS reductase)/FAD synthetase
MLTVSYFSAGVSSAVATKLLIDEIDRIMYTHIDDQHPDTMRFVKECEEWFGKPVEIWQSPVKNVENACRYAGGFIRNPKTGAARCTTTLKRFVRKEFEEANPGPKCCVWGMDCNEQDRCDRILQSMSEFEHRFPLLERGMTKEDAHKILKASGIKRPAMYDLGYHNNNCIGCVKGGMGYWNKIRVDFPDVFASRAKMERDIGFSILGRAWLDELDPERGRHEGPICEDCGIMCELMAM